MPTLRKRWHFGQIFPVILATKVHLWTMTLNDIWHLNRECIWLLTLCIYLLSKLTISHVHVSQQLIMSILFIHLVIMEDGTIFEVSSIV